MTNRIDHIDSSASQELVTDTQVLLKEMKENQKSLVQIRKEYKDILTSFDSQKLQRIITKLYIGKTTAQIQQHPSHDLVAQLCLDYLGFDHTEVDSAI